MKICTACQAVNALEANFCSLCRAPLERSSRSAYCPKGHAMHPSWPECLECKGERSMAQDFGAVPPRTPTVMDSGALPARGATAVESFAEPQPVALPIPIPPRPARPADQTQVGPESLNTTLPFGSAATGGNPPPVAVSRRVTQFAGALASPGPRPPAQRAGAAADDKRPGRKIVGMLLTYTWKPEGQIFAVREGRNLIGRNADCDISIPEDPHLSDTNSHITYRRSFTVGDMVSMSGTDLNGEPVEENFVRMPNYSRLRTGSTHFVFIAAEAPAAGDPGAQE